MSKAISNNFFVEKFSDSALSQSGVDVSDGEFDPARWWKVLPLVVVTDHCVHHILSRTQGLLSALILRLHAHGTCQSGRVGRNRVLVGYDKKIHGVLT